MNTLEVPLRKTMNPKKRSSLDNDGVILKYKQSKKSNSTPAILEKMINNPGLHHIVEEIFLNLDFKSIVASKLVNKSFQDIVENPFFWLKMWRLRLGLSKKNHKDWINAIKIIKNTDLRKIIVRYVQYIIEFGHFVDVPCFIDNKNVAEFSNGILINQTFKFWFHEFFKITKLGHETSRVLDISLDVLKYFKKRRMASLLGVKV